MKPTKFSYSKLNTYGQCGWKYHLTYDEGHFIPFDSIATELGSLIHACEESIARTLQAGQKPDYDKLREMLREGTPKLAGIDTLQKKYADDYFAVDGNGSSYYTRVLDYMDSGIYRLENYLTEHPTFTIYGMEQFFSVEYHGQILSGYIDRIFYDQATETYIVEDIKTKNKLFRDEDLVTPLQFVVYVYALAENLGLGYEHFRCAYDLPFMNKKQDAGTPGFMQRGIKKLDSLFAGIESRNYEPGPSPLCHFCPFCPTNPEQPEAGKLLCPYYSLWTRTNKTHAVAHKWQGIEKHEAIMADEIAKQSAKSNSAPAETDGFDW